MTFEAIAPGTHKPTEVIPAEQHRAAERRERYWRRCSAVWGGRVEVWRTRFYLLLGVALVGLMFARCGK